MALSPVASPAAARARADRIREGMKALAPEILAAWHSPQAWESAAVSPALRASIERTPIPTEAGVPVRACVTSDADGQWRTAWAMDGGRDKQLFGPAYSLRDALAAAAELNRRAGQ